MGTLGEYLHDARVAKGIDLRDAAQQTRISMQYLKALEQEDFSKLPGEVFVRGFLKNYGRFLNLDESEVIKRYSELKSKAAPPAAAVPPQQQQQVDHAAASSAEKVREETPLEPFIWGAVIAVLFLVFLFTALPSRVMQHAGRQAGPAVPAVISHETGSVPAATQKLYLEVAALEDTWVLVRTDDSPQKKAVLKRGESLTWSADERFLISYGRVGAVKLTLNGQELTVNGTKETPVRDLAVTRAGIVNQPPMARLPQPAKPKPRAAAQAQSEPEQPKTKQETVTSPAQPAAALTPAPSTQPTLSTPR